MAENIEEFKKHLKVYWYVFGALMALTFVTVAASWLKVPMGAAVAIALVIAAAKAGLVAAYFMHLIDDKKVIAVSWTLILTAFFFAVVLLIPVLTETSSLVVS